MQIDGKLVLAIIAAVATGLGGFFAARAGFEQRIADLERKLLAIQDVSLADFVVSQSRQILSTQPVGVSETQLQTAISQVPKRRSDAELISLINEKLSTTELQSSYSEDDIRSWIRDAVVPFKAFEAAKGAVIAFDRSEDRGGGEIGGACPVGWALFKPAGGRFIIGAGSHPNFDGNGEPLDDYRAYADNQIDATGGFEQVTLHRDQMPSHDHPAAQVGLLPASGPRLRVSDVGTAGSITMPYGFGFSSDVKESATDRVVDHRGGGKPHENMPPYIALYFCKKE